MKKFFSFVAASAMMLATGSALADTVVIYSWEGGSEAATESGGTVAANGSNTAVSASRITVSAKKADIATNNVTISLEEALAAGDVITITGYRDKDETRSEEHTSELQPSMREATMSGTTSMPMPLAVLKRQTQTPTPSPTRQAAQQFSWLAQKHRPTYLSRSCLLLER